MGDILPFPGGRDKRWEEVYAEVINLEHNLVHFRIEIGELALQYRVSSLDMEEYYGDLYKELLNHMVEEIDWELTYGSQADH